MVLTEEGDVDLVPAPYHVVFDADVKIIPDVVRCRCTRTMDNPTIGPTREDLEKIVAAVEAEGSRICILLITNPNNPLGTIFGRCDERGLDWTDQGICIPSWMSCTVCRVIL